MLDPSMGRGKQNTTDPLDPLDPLDPVSPPWGPTSRVQITEAHLARSSCDMECSDLEAAFFVARKDHKIPSIYIEY